jgi:hypothetical protein
MWRPPLRPRLNGTLRDPATGGHRDAGHGDGERGATLLAAADAALALMNVARA